MTTTARPDRGTAGAAAVPRPGRPAQYLLSRAAGPARPIVASPEQRAVIGHRQGRLRVLAGPGTGKTEMIVQAVAERIGDGTDPSEILVLTYSRRAARELSARISTRLRATTVEPMVRTLHSFAYAVVRAAATAADDPPPRLLDAGETDLMVRDMLAGHADDGGERWPEHLRPALRVPAFAAELREFLLRTAERRIDPARIAALGRRRRRPEWVAAAAFITEDRDIGDLRQGTGRLGAALDQAELTAAAVDRLADPAVLATYQQRIRRIFVDEYQDVDPAQAQLVDLLASGADEFVVVGDPDQSVYAFRGAATGALDRVIVDETVPHGPSYRLPSALRAATRRVAERLPGQAAHRALRPADLAAPATLHVRVLGSADREATFVADQLRRAHLQRQVPWSAMAILLRSPSGSAEPLRRACVRAGVPVTEVSGAPPAANPLTQALLTTLRAGVEPDSLTGEVALALLASPLGGMDPLALRRLRRAVRADQGPARVPDDAAEPGGSGSSGDLLAAMLLDRREVPGGLPADLDRPLRRVRSLVATATAGATERAAETVLWRVWEQSGLAAPLVAASDRQGRQAVAADDMLDAAVELFRRAADLADQLPGAGVRGLLDLVAGEQIGRPSGRAEGPAETVAILSAHAAKGLEWDVVAVAGVQQDRWPDLRPRASLLDLAGLLDADAGHPSGLPAAGRLADERRLFYVAATRARRLLLVTAVQDEEHAPSRFLAEIAGTEAVPTGWPVDASGSPHRALNLPALVAELRRTVTAPGGGAGEGERARAAATALARLAEAGVPGAAPDQWYGLLPSSTAAPLVADGAEVVLSPSQIEALLACPLRAVLQRSGARTAPGQPQLLGIAVHAIAQGIAAGAGVEELDAAAEEFLAAQESLPTWEVERLRRMLTAMRGALRRWVSQSAIDRTFVGAEVPMDTPLPVSAPSATAGPTEHPVRLVGRVDWLSRDEQGRIIVTDFKSGATPPTRAEVAEHAQLAVYQLAAALGAFDSGAGGDGVSAHARVGGAELVYLRTGKPKVLGQPPQSPPDRARWLGRLADAARSAAGSTLTARESEQCDRCPVRTSCPLQPEGRQVTR
jgi:superfamily I DNA/RNA helicase/RecB family exonuclease